MTADQNSRWKELQQKVADKTATPEECNEFFSMQDNNGVFSKATDMAISQSLKFFKDRGFNDKQASELDDIFFDVSKVLIGPLKAATSKYGMKSFEAGILFGEWQAMILRNAAKTVIGESKQAN